MRGKFDCIPPTFFAETPSIRCAGHPLVVNTVGVRGHVHMPNLMAPWWNVGEETWPVYRWLGVCKVEMGENTMHQRAPIPANTLYGSPGHSLSPFDLVRNAPIDEGMEGERVLTSSQCSTVIQTAPRRHMQGG